VDIARTKLPEARRKASPFGSSTLKAEDLQTGVHLKVLRVMGQSQETRMAVRGSLGPGGERKGEKKNPTVLTTLKRDKAGRGDGLN